MNTEPDPGPVAPALPGYQFVRHLGTGGYSEVYLYEREMPRRNVAVKVLNGTGLTEATRRQFTEEANAMAGLADHPNIVQVIDAAIASDGRPYLVMQYCPHANLNVRARREHFSVTEALRIGIQVGSAVETAHRNGILHRDVKPHNVLTDQYGTPALTDFGIAARKGADDSGPDGISVPWSAPEVLYGAADGDERADVYSLAATVWHVLVGHSPFEQPGGDNSTLALMRRIQTDPPPTTRRDDVPGSLERLLRQAMAKDPAVRPQSALDFVRALQAIEQEQRLPLTQIVIAAERSPAPEAAVASVDDTTRVRPSVPVYAQPPASLSEPGPRQREGGDRAGAESSVTRVRGNRIEPMPAARAIPPQRSRVLPSSPPAAATRDRPVAAAPVSARQAPGKPGAEPASGRSRRMRGIAAVVIVVLAAVIVAVVLALPHHSTGTVAGGKTKSSGRGTSALGPGVSAPGTPDVAVVSAPAGHLRFSWTYANRARGDVFRWHRVSGGSGPKAGTTATPMLLLPKVKGKSVCITVQVVRADGSQASTPSAPACGS